MEIMSLDVKDFIIKDTLKRIWLPRCVVFVKGTNTFLTLVLLI